MHKALPVLLLALSFALIAVGVARRHMRDLDQQRRELFAPPQVAAGGEGTERIAMITLATRDDVLSLRLADLDKILARQFQRRFDRLRPAGAEIGARNARRRACNQCIGQRLHRLIGKKRCMCEGDPVYLRLDGSRHTGIAVTEARNRSTA